MQLKIIQDSSEFDKIGTEWNALLAKSASHVPFLRHEYLSAWWKTLGGGEWAQGDLYIILGLGADKNFSAAAPLFKTTTADGQLAFLFLGSFEISDYLDFICPPDLTFEFLEAVFDHLGQLPATDWSVLDLYNLLEDSASLAAIQQLAEQKGWAYSAEKIQPAPAIELAATWDEYLAGIVKKQRHEIRRKIRRAESHSEPVRWYIVEDPQTLDAEMEAFLALMAYDAEKEAFLTDVMRTQMKKSVHAAFEAGWLQLAFLEVGGEKAAAYLNFDYANRVWVYNSGINFKFSNLSPGWVLAGYLIQWAIENGREVFDFMRGDEVYKYRLGGVDRFVLRVQIGR